MILYFYILQGKMANVKCKEETNKIFKRSI